VIAGFEAVGGTAVETSSLRLNFRSLILAARCRVGWSFNRIQSSGRTSPAHAIARISRAR